MIQDILCCIRKARNYFNMFTVSPDNLLRKKHLRRLDLSIAISFSFYSGLVMTMPMELIFARNTFRNN